MPAKARKADANAAPQDAQSSELRITVVDDAPCPECGHGYPNRPKVDKWWKCNTDGCRVAYYCPDTGEVEYRLGPEEEAAAKAQAEADVEKLLAENTAVSRKTRYGSETNFVPNAEVDAWLASHAKDGWVKGHV
jgi:hypothetical protein